MFRTGNYVSTPQFPQITGYEVAGTVEAIGPGVEGIAIGDKVSVVPCFSLGEYGLHGELVNAPAFGVVKHPDNLSWDKAAATWRCSSPPTARWSTSPRRGPATSC
jgi:NADPH:quinone reductase-like Zn-dependent oxidoreductase